MAGYYYTSNKYLALASGDILANDLPNLPQQSALRVVVKYKLSK
jgi:hypothetical protein